MVFVQRHAPTSECRLESRQVLQTGWFPSHLTFLEKFYYSVVSTTINSPITANITGVVIRAPSFVRRFLGFSLHVVDNQLITLSASRIKGMVDTRSVAHTLYDEGIVCG